MGGLVNFNVVLIIWSLRFSIVVLLVYGSIGVVWSNKLNNKFFSNMLVRI